MLGPKGLREDVAREGTSRGVEACAVLRHGIGQSEVKGVRNQSMPNAHLVEVGNAFCEVAQVAKVEVMSRVDAQTGIVRPPCRLGIRLGGLASEAWEVARGCACLF